MGKILVILVTLIFIGCGEKNSAFRYFDVSDLESQVIQHSKKTDIVKNNRVELILWATYLNNIDNIDVNNNTENFIVSFYSLKKNIKAYNFMLNDKNSISIKKIDAKDKKYKKYFLKNTWSDYYLVKFHKQDVYKMNFKITNNESSASILFNRD